MDGTPAFFRAACNTWACSSGTVVSLAPCTIRNGGASLVICVTGLASAASFFRSDGAPPSSRPTGPLALSLLFSILKKSDGPQKSQTACTLLENPSQPPLPSSSLRCPLVPSSATRCPPADEPQTPMRFGSRLYSLALARRK